jgi:DNA-binding response OmpR family regulator
MPVDFLIEAGQSVANVPREREMARLLLVEDDPLLAMMIGDWLTEAGVDVVGPAGRVAEALALIESKGEGLDGALLDVSLGRGDSFPVADALAARGLPFAFCTGRGASELPARFAGAPLLEKPFLTRELQQVVAALLSMSRANLLRP